MSTTLGTTSPTPTRAPHFALAVLALAMGGFAIGTTEFVTMGLIREIATGVDVSIPTAGHVISAYALGVVVGAPVLAFFGAKWPRRGLLVALMAAYAVFNALSALATSFELLALARFFDGLPHGAYFGVASLVAASLAPPERKGRAVAMVMLGLSVANVLGVPATTWLGQHLGWRAAFWAVSVLALVTVAMILAFVPSVPGDSEATGRRELAAFSKPQVWLTLLVGAVGFGGMFAVFSYIAPTVTELGGLGDGAVPVFLLVFGLGMVAGTWLAGELADWSIMKSLLGSSVGMGVLLVLFFFAAPHGWLLLPVAFGITTLGSVLVVNLQLRLMDVAGDAQTLGAAMNHAALNVANALGAWLGGLVIAAGYGYRAPALVGVGLSVAGFVVLVVSARAQLRSNRREPVSA
ncbi:MFS transporter [Nocardioides psychrotolerans]|uniref:MFS transporter, DHA1 family, inner membrane transport protein n=1 Tax=Nocardioides psychrotolerans TaxID=1005945 RepID=A0A1I3BDW8_9ACTN|nr:MFS transporter [Nocardioides psychrotolerans]GEP36692.1 MFS transporter [Nocardioides psychrotolerans]SFH60494.1 MFS transporter, DHA1 family, inner membrane transport protein [Nocardioides psychrotolerans]